MNRQALHQAGVWYYSASQLKSADSCIRIWAWEKLCGFVEPAGPAAALGTDVHEVLEKWLGDGHPLNPHTRVGQIAIAGLDHLPPPGPELEIEREFHIRIGKHYFRGKVDVGFLDVTGLPWVIDHKTTSDFMWQLGPEDLIDDIQALIYAKEALDRYGVDEVQLRWIYYRTKTPYKAQVTDLRVTRQDVELRWPIIEEIASMVDAVRLNVVNPLDLSPNANSCAKFGGCPHMKRCNLTAQERMTSIMTQQARKTDIKAKMAARVASRQGGAPQAVPSAAPPANQPPMQQQPQYQPQPVAAQPQQQVVQQAPQQQMQPVQQVQQQPVQQVQQQPVQQQPVQQVPQQQPVAQQPVQQVPQQQPVAQQPAQQVPQHQPVAQQPVQQNVVPMNPPEQPPMQMQLSTTVVEEQAAPTNRANEQEATATTEKKARKPRAKKPTGFVVEDKRTAFLLVHAAAASSGDPNAINQALQAVTAMFQE